MGYHPVAASNLSQKHFFDIYVWASLSLFFFLLSFFEWELNIANRGQWNTKRIAVGLFHSEGWACLPPSIWSIPGVQICWTQFAMQGQTRDPKGSLQFWEVNQKMSDQSWKRHHTVAFTVAKPQSWTHCSGSFPHQHLPRVSLLQPEDLATTTPRLCFIGGSLGGYPNYPKWIYALYLSYITHIDVAIATTNASWKSIMLNACTFLYIYIYLCVCVCAHDQQ